MSRWTTATALVALLFAGAVLVRAEENKEAPKKPLGTWTRNAGDAEIKFNFTADTLTVTIKAGDATIEAVTDYAVTKDGFIYGRVRKCNKTGTDGGPEEGDLFSFRVQAADTALTISELKSTKESAEAKQLVEGEYKKAG